MALFGRQKTDAEAQLVCPHDGAAMTKLEVRNVRIDRCDSCGGTWFDVRELARVASDSDVERLASRIPINAVDSPFRCPRCAGRCVENHVEEVEVDHCLECRGVWLDRGELTEAKRQVHAERLVAGQRSGFRAFLSGL